MSEDTTPKESKTDSNGENKGWQDISNFFPLPTLVIRPDSHAKERSTFPSNLNTKILSLSIVSLLDY